MESALTSACTIRIQNFEGPLDLLCHLIEKSKMSIYDIRINEITDQYLDYLYSMKTMDLEIASEFLLMASNLLHIKSKMLLPQRKEKKEEESDPREELVSMILQYKRFKEVAQVFQAREKEWSGAYFKLPEVFEPIVRETPLELDPERLAEVYDRVMERKRGRTADTSGKMTQIIQVEKVTLRSKVREVVRWLASHSFFKFSEIFSLKRQSKLEVVTGFMAVLELTRVRRVRLEQTGLFRDIMIFRGDGEKSDDDGHQRD